MVRAQEWVEEWENERRGYEGAYGPGLAAAGTVRSVAEEWKR